MEGGDDRHVFTSEVFARKNIEDMDAPARGAVLVEDAKRWRDEQEKFPIRPRLS